MKNRPVFIQEILKKQTITGYLEEKGILPVSQDSKPAIYHCPSPDHDDSTPSFYVYENNHFEYFKCLGC